MLEYLKLYYNQLEGTIPPELGQLGNLHLLNLNGNRVNGQPSLPNSDSSLQLEGTGP